MHEDLVVLKGYIESLGLAEKAEITFNDMKQLEESLNESDEISLAKYVSSLKDPRELKELIEDTLSI